MINLNCWRRSGSFNLLSLRASMKWIWAFDIKFLVFSLLFWAWNPHPFARFVRYGTSKRRYIWIPTLFLLQIPCASAFRVRVSNFYKSRTPHILDSELEVMIFKPLFSCMSIFLSLSFPTPTDDPSLGLFFIFIFGSVLESTWRVYFRIYQHLGTLENFVSFILC